MRTLFRSFAVGALAIGLLAANQVSQIDVPRVVVYPLTPYGSAQSTDGERLATLIAEVVGEAGGVDVRAAPPGVERSAYLETAQRLGADYYLSGFVSSVAGRLAVVEQLVRTSTATLAWSNNVQVLTDGDMRAQGEVVRSAVLDLAHPPFVELRIAPKPSATSAAPRPALQLPKLGAAAPVPAPAPAPTTAAIAVLRMAGEASDDGKAYAAAAIVAALKAHGEDAAASAEPATYLPILAPAVCASTGAKVLVGGTLSIATEGDHLYGPWSTAKIDVAGYDCVHARSLAMRSGTAGSYRWRWAVDQAADQTIAVVRLR